MVKDDSIIATISTNETQMKVHFGFDLTFGQLLEQENKEKTKNVEHVVENEIEKYAEIEPFQEDEEYGDAMDYVESYFDNGEADDAFDDDENHRLIQRISAIHSPQTSVCRAQQVFRREKREHLEYSELVVGAGRSRYVVIGNFSKIADKILTRRPRNQIQPKFLNYYFIINFRGFYATKIFDSLNIIFALIL
ncbi:14386_t:CDS:2 [Funneliformis caledonium]|uniref:14386_t:CDS:1 n=1 Tax=Funneliformis caledonium TaxID=1117310 RepID=A0A9N9A7N3_9GLOM|nr:14386_t:CDS:2 [Funneliformis caledonium]